MPAPSLTRDTDAIASISTSHSGDARPWTMTVVEAGATPGSSRRRAS
jgi:hypothetical protein